MNRSSTALVLVLLFLIPIAALAQGEGVQYSGSPLARRISIKLNGVTLQQALSEITRETRIRFSYASNIVSGNKTIRVSLKSEPLDIALGKILDQVDVTWKPVTKSLIVLAKKKVDPPGKPGTIVGSVRDAATGDPLPGANVLLKGTSIGASTDLGGHFAISDIPSGSYVLRISYIGYNPETVEIHVHNGETLTEHLHLTAVGIRGRNVVVTAQASGQNNAINQQLSANKIVDVVSAARIQQLPDANAAESVGRLPGVSVIRSGGEATEVVIRGMQPKYNEILIDGVEMAATSSGSRSTNLSMISSNSLSGIEVYKTVTPDMDAAAIGGVVNFRIREAQKSHTGAPELSLVAQTGYNALVNRYGNYKFVGTVQNRYLHDKLGVFVQGIVQRQNYTDDELGSSYDMVSGTTINGNQTALQSLSVSFIPREENRYDGTVVLDYRLPNGKINLMNFFSRGDEATTTFNQNYSLSSNNITFNDSYSTNQLNTVTSLLDYKQDIGSLDLDAKVSQSFSDNNTPHGWSMDFLQNAANTGQIKNSLSPLQIAKQAYALINLRQMFFDAINVSSSYTKQQNITGSLDLQTRVDFSNDVNVILKTGGSFRYTSRWHSQSTAYDGLYYAAGQLDRQDILSTFPWMTQPPYNLNPNGAEDLPIALFEDKGVSFGNFLSGDYGIGPGTNIGLIGQSIQTIIDSSKYFNYTQKYKPNNLSLIESNYHGQEYRGAGFLMATLNIGSNLTIIPGVRYQGLTTSYFAPRIYTAVFPYEYPAPYPHQDTTINEYHGYWLPDIDLIYKPFHWLSGRLSYTNTLSYPDFTQITPLIIYRTNSITWHNFALNPARAQNYDAGVSVYNNGIGLLSVDGFLKRISGMIFGTGPRYPESFSSFPGVIASGLSPTTLYSINYSINDPYRTDVWGVEAEWQTHFWYLPHPLDGLVLNVNFTHIFSGAKYPFTYNYQVLNGRQLSTVYVDTFYTDRLFQQPDNIANLSLGYDYKGFSILVSMIYQSNVFNSNNFYPALRVDKAKYERWDLAAKQNLPWKGVEVYLDINDLNNESDVYEIQGPGFPQSVQDYGMTADFGLRLKI